MAKLRLIHIDLETLALHPTEAVVLDIGIVADTYTVSNGIVNADSVERRTYTLTPSLQEQLNKNRLVTADTLLWWFRQDTEAREAIACSQETAEPLAFVANDLYNIFCDLTKGVDKVWVLASAPSLDLELVKSLMAEYNKKPKWFHWQELNQRTLRHLAAPSMLPARDSFAHDALNDALYQADCIKHLLSTHDADHYKPLCRILGVHHD